MVLTARELKSPGPKLANLPMAREPLREPCWVASRPAEKRSKPGGKKRPRERQAPLEPPILLREEGPARRAPPEPVLLVVLPLEPPHWQESVRPRRRSTAAPGTHSPLLSHHRHKQGNSRFPLRTGSQVVHQTHTSDRMRIEFLQLRGLKRAWWYCSSPERRRWVLPLKTTNPEAEVKPSPPLGPSGNGHM